MREFDTGATRDNEEGKLDFEGFLSPLVLECYAEYMHKHRKQADGQLRDSDNWQKGMPLSVYMKSKWRHFFQTWKWHRQHEPLNIIDRKLLLDSLCAELFNTMGMIHELLGERTDATEKTEEATGRVEQGVSGEAGEESK